jgi:hypothetical protein
MSSQWATSVNELAQIFREGLIALLPVADKAHMPWKEPNNYDDWDTIATSLFESIVTRSLEEAREWNHFDPLPKFNQRIEDYSKNSFLAVTKAETTLAFICFETKVTPFDRCLFARLDEMGKVLDLVREDFSSVKFLLVGRLKDGLVRLDSVDVRL